MSTIANLAKQKDGSFLGTLLIPSLNGQKIVLTPVEKKGKGPELRATIGAYEAGAAWKRETETATYFRSSSTIRLSPGRSTAPCSRLRTATP
jgi:uncharacterized protein (DUF736 family)